MTELTKAEKLAKPLDFIYENEIGEILDFRKAAAELRRLSPMEAKVKKLEDALQTIAALGNCIDVDCKAIAKKALGETK